MIESRFLAAVYKLGRFWDKGQVVGDFHIRRIHFFQYQTAIASQRATEKQFPMVLPTIQSLNTQELISLGPLDSR